MNTPRHVRSSNADGVRIGARRLMSVRGAQRNVSCEPTAARCASEGMDVQCNSFPRLRFGLVFSTSIAVSFPQNSLRTATRARRGFTLLELIIALSLCLLLMSAVYGSLQLYWRLQSTGQEQVERAQIARAILRRMTIDVGSVVFTAPKTEETGETASTGSSVQTSGSSGSSGSSTDGASEETTIEVEDASSAYVSSSMGIVGDSQTLVLHISRPTRDLTYAALAVVQDLRSRSSDIRSVSYFLASPGGAGLAGSVAPAAVVDRKANAYVAADSGLARLEGDRLAIEFADLSLDYEALGSAAQIVAPEVVALTFRYFDGTAWLESWDSTAAGRLPQAIEVTLGIAWMAAPPPQGAVSTFAAEPVPVETVRHVLHVPLAGPYVPEY